jgi:hypothetical protein
MGVQSWGCPGRAGSALVAPGVLWPRRECPGRGGSVPNLWRAISLRVLVRMEQVSSPSASTRRVDVENGVACAIWIPDRKVMPGGSSGVPK